MSLMLFSPQFFTKAGQRAFDVLVEGQSTENVDIVARSGASEAMTLDYVVDVTDGILNIELKDSTPKIDRPSKLTVIMRWLCTFVLFL